MNDQSIIEKAFLAVMNANDRDLGLPLSDWAGRNLLKRRIAVALRAVQPALRCEDDQEAFAWEWLEDTVSATCDENPSDIAYSADQMVDAFMAGMQRAAGGTE